VTCWQNANFSSLLSCQRFGEIASLPLHLARRVELDHVEIKLRLILIASEGLQQASAFDDKAMFQRPQFAPRSAPASTRHWRGNPYRACPSRANPNWPKTVSIRRGKLGLFGLWFMIFPFVWWDYPVDFDAPTCHYVVV
jgi:hypothetical protein